MPQTCTERSNRESEGGRQRKRERRGGGGEGGVLLLHASIPFQIGWAEKESGSSLPLVNVSLQVFGPVMRRVVKVMKKKTKDLDTQRNICSL